jgi:fatty acid-binding protein DegV
LSKIAWIVAPSGNEVLGISFSKRLSGTYNVVRLLGEQTEGLDVFVLDTKNIGIGAGIQAILFVDILKWLH